MSRYPSEQELDAIKVWDYKDMRSCFDFIQSIWAYPEYAWIEEDKLHLATGGWSGNEDIIWAMKENPMLWLMTWESSHRGGKYVFDLSRIPEVSNERD